MSLLLSHWHFEISPDEGIYTSEIDKCHKLGFQDPHSTLTPTLLAHHGLAATNQLLSLNLPNDSGIDTWLNHLILLMIP